MVFLQGPRQAGKSTLVQQLASHEKPRPYITFDDSPVLAAAQSDPDGFIDALPDRVVLDEIQRVPDLFRSLKRAVDRRRTPGRFLLTGSANALMLPPVAESLAGRLELLTLWPFSQGELEDRSENFVDTCFAQSPPPAFNSSPDAGWPFLAERIARGGYPEAQTRSAERLSAWFGSYITTILEREVRDISNVHGLREMPRILRLAATRVGGLLNYAEVARDSGLPQSTLKRHWALFEATFLLWTIPAWATNLGQRQVKSPKVLFGDSGLLCWLLGLDAERLKADHLMTGGILESFVASELLKQITWSRVRPSLYHYRTHAGQEVDLVLEDRAGRLVGIEVKKSASPREEDFANLRRFKLATGPRFHRGILLHTGSQSASLSSDLQALPVPALWRGN